MKKVKRLFFAPNGYVPKCYFYGRVSHKGQFDKGDSVEGQRARLSQYWELRKLVDPTLVNVQFGGEYMEPLAQSATTKPLPRRHAGRQLVQILQPGDHIVVDSFDRIFRDVDDFRTHRRYFDERGIHLHIVNYFGGSIDTGCAFGRFMGSFAALMAEFEADQKGERVSKARAHLRANGKHSGAGIPWICERVGGKEGYKRGAGGRLRYRAGYREITSRIVTLRDQDHMPWEQIANLLETERLQALGKPVPVFDQFNRHAKDRYYSRSKIWSGYWFEKALRWKGEPDPNKINFLDIVAEYRAWLKSQEAA